MPDSFMKAALREASIAAVQKEAPIGAVAVKDGKIIARAHNLRESRNDPLGHAEISLLIKLSKKLNGWRMNGVTVYVTLEPCLMCMGAMIQARVPRLVFGAMVPKAGEPRSNHKMDVTSGVLEAECSAILKKFFKGLRQAPGDQQPTRPTHLRSRRSR